MSVQQFINFLSQHSLYIIIYFVAVFILAFGLSIHHKKSPTKLKSQLLSTLVFLVSIPGIMATIIIFYSLFFIRQNLLEVNMVLYFLPIIAMILTLFVIAKYTSLNSLPGFNRLSGLITLLILIGIVILLLYKLRFFIGFFGSMQSLFIIGVILYFIFNGALKKLGGKK